MYISFEISEEDNNCHFQHSVFVRDHNCGVFLRVTLEQAVSLGCQDWMVVMGHRVVRESPVCLVWMASMAHR